MAMQAGLACVADVRACEHVANKLYGQCRDSPSPYKLLTGSIRRIRNVLGEVVDAFDNVTNLGSDEVKVLQRVSQSRAVLDRLDLALVSHISPSVTSNVADGLLSEFRTSIDDVTDDLVATYEIMTATGEINLKLDSFITIPAGSSAKHSVTSSISGHRQFRQSSQGSTALSFVPDNTLTDTSCCTSATTPNDDASKFSASDEKESCLPTVYVPTTPAARLHTGPASWLSPFATPDPLSLPFDQAHKIILGLSDPDTPATTALSTSSQPVIVATATNGRHSGTYEPELAVSELREEIAEAFATPAHDQEELVPGQWATSASTANHKPVRPSLGERHTSSKTILTVGEDTVAQASKDIAKPESPLITLVQPSEPPVDSVPDLDDIDSESSPSACPALTPPQEYKEQKMSDSPNPPALPARPPPIVPLMTRVPRIPPRPSRYRVVNADVPTSPTDVDTTVEDLYTSSRPSSPSSTANNLQANVEASSLLPTVPQLVVDSSQCQDDNQPRSPMAWRHSAAIPTVNTDLALPPSHQVPASIQPSPIYTSGNIDVPSVQKTRPFSLLPPAKSGEVHDSTLRKGTEEVLVQRVTRHLKSASQLVGRHARSASTSQLATTIRNVEQKPGIIEYYSGREENKPQGVLDRESIFHIVNFWDWRRWDLVENHLNAFLQSLIERGDWAKTRRVQHLLGVCESFRGRYHQALLHFRSVLQTPIHDVSRLDYGDSVAAHWMGDIYAMQNRRAEAVFAYAIAEMRPLLENRDGPGMYMSIAAERRWVGANVSDRDVEDQWVEGQDEQSDSILTSTVVSRAVMTIVLQNSQQSTRSERSSFGLSRSRRRAADLDDLDTTRVRLLERSREQSRLTLISNTCFEFGAPWPLPFDPFFTMANVCDNRLPTHGCDMLQKCSTDQHVRIHRALPKLDGVTSTDLPWLISNIRSTLQSIDGCEWLELVDGEGPRFACQYPATVQAIACTRYFAITIFRSSLRSGYGASICSEGISSARLVSDQSDHSDRGVPHSEVDRIRKLIRGQISTAGKSRPKAGKEANRSSTVQLAQEVLARIPPPLPQRPI